MRPLLKIYVAMGAASMLLTSHLAFATPGPEQPATTAETLPPPKAGLSAEDHYQRGHDAISAGDNVWALEEFRKSCAMNHAKSCYNVGTLKQADGDAKAETLEEVEQIAKAYWKACVLGFQKGCVAEARFYSTDRYGRQDLAKAEAMFSKACFEGETTGCEDLAELHYQGRAANSNLDLAATLFKKGCDEGGNALNCFNYGLMREKGQGAPKSSAAALEYYRLGCRKGAEPACISLAIVYANQGESIAAKKLFGQSCDRGTLQACANLGELLRNSAPNHPDNSVAADIFRKACTKGDGQSCRALGQMAQDGSKAAGPKSAGIRFFEKGCELQYARSCYNAGFSYWSGYHAPKDPRLGLKWYAKGCDLNSASNCAGASLAALSFDKGDPDGGEVVARQWFDRAYALDPDNQLVAALKDWYDRDAPNAVSPPMPSAADEKLSN